MQLINLILIFLTKYYKFLLDKVFFDKVFPYLLMLLMMVNSTLLVKAFLLLNQNLIIQIQHHIIYIMLDLASPNIFLIIILTKIHYLLECNIQAEILN